MIVMKQGATENQIDHVINKIEEAGAKADVSKGKYKTVIGAVGDRERIVTIPFEAFPGVEKVVPILTPFKLVSRVYKPRGTEIKVKDLTIGGDYFTIMAGPCSVETEEQMISTAKAIKEAGAHMLRGGAFKPRTSPYSFQGHGEKGLKILAKAREETGLPVVTEVMDTRDVDLVAEYADVLQIGARNMQNFLLLTEVGKVKKPIFLKRGFSNTTDELLMAAEYIASEGNQDIILCERGIRTFEPSTRNTLDISAIPVLNEKTHLPVVVDPSHASGKRDLIEPLTLASIAAGAHGAMIEVHPNPEEAWSDGAQSLTFDDFKKMMEKVKNLASALRKKMVG